MTIYKYKAVDDEGHPITGRMDVASESDLQKNLESRGFFLVSFTRETPSILTEDLFGKWLPIS